MNIEIIHLSEDLQVKHIDGEEFVILSGKYRIKANRSCILKLLDQFHRAESFMGTIPHAPFAQAFSQSLEELENGFGNNDRSEPDLRTDQKTMHSSRRS